MHGRRAADREQKGRQQPAGQGSGRGDVVGIDQHRIVSDRIGGEGDGVRLQDQDLLPGHVHGGDVLADARVDQKRRVLEREFIEKLLQEIIGQLAGRQRNAHADEPVELREVTDPIIGHRPGRIRRRVRAPLDRNGPGVSCQPEHIAVGGYHHEPLRSGRMLRAAARKGLRLRRSARGASRLMQGRMSAGRI